MFRPIDPMAVHRTSRIVGREREQALLRHALDDMLTGHGSTRAGKW